MIDAVRNWTLDGVLEEHCRSFPDRVAFVSGDTRYTFLEARQRVDRLAAALAQAHVKRGDRILWLAQNSHCFMETLLAAARLGAMFCPANWRQSPAELAALLEDLEPHAVIWQDEEIGAAVSAAKTKARHSTAVWLQLDSTGPGSYESFLASGGEYSPVPVDPAEPLLIVYTAAFDGRPNGAMLSQTAILCQNLILAPTANITNETTWLSTGAAVPSWYVDVHHGHLPSGGQECLHTPLRREIHLRSSPLGTLHALLDRGKNDGRDHRTQSRGRLQFEKPARAAVSSAVGRDGDDGDAASRREVGRIWADPR